jgi:hypothetical protein
MLTPFTELIIQAPFLLVKGFLLGFMHGRNESFDYFFHRKAGIRRETLTEKVKEVLSIENYTELCLPDNIVNEFIQALGKIDPFMGISVTQKQSIKGAEFKFNFTLYDEHHAEICKQLFTYTPATIEIVDFHPEEKRENQVIGIQEYAPVHPYSFEGKGVVRGEFEGVMNFYLTIKRSELAEQIVCKEIDLHF